MLAIGAAERGLALMVERVNARIAFGRPLADQGVVQRQVALFRNEIDHARLLCHKAAWTIDQHGNKSKDAQVLSRRSSPLRHRWHATCLTAQFRCTARWACVMTSRSCDCMAGIEPCGCSTAPMRFIYARSRDTN